MYRRLGRMLGNRLMVPMGIEPFDTGGYIRKVLTPDGPSGYDPAGLIGFWPQNEAAGGVSFDHSGLGHNGLYTAVDLGQPGVPDMGMTSAGYDGATSFNNIYSAALNTAFNGAEGTLLGWGKVDDWTDGAAGYIARLYVDGDNYIFIAKIAANNSVTFTYEAGNVTESQTTAALSNTGFAPYAMTWSKSGDRVHYYIGGVASGPADIGLGVWVGNLSNTVTVIGAGNTVPATVFPGNLAPVLLYNEAKSPTEIAYLSTV